MEGITESGGLWRPVSAFVILCNGKGMAVALFGSDGCVVKEEIVLANAPRGPPKEREPGANCGKNRRGQRFGQGKKDRNKMLAREEADSNAATQLMDLWQRWRADGVDISDRTLAEKIYLQVAKVNYTRVFARGAPTAPVKGKKGKKEKKGKQASKDAEVVHTGAIDPADPRIEFITFTASKLSKRELWRVYNRLHRTTATEVASWTAELAQLTAAVEFTITHRLYDQATFRLPRGDPLDTFLRLVAPLPSEVRFHVICKIPDTPVPPPPPSEGAVAWYLQRLRHELVLQPP